jgi:hypothetical protein
MRRRTNSISILGCAASELEQLRSVPTHDGRQFPRACRALLYSLPGNSRCVDCGAVNPGWASVSYGVLLCLNCSGRHRSYGVMNSKVKSVDMDAWTHEQVLAMLEGGNEQLQHFFERHHMGNSSDPSPSSMTCTRYKTKASLFYRSNLKQHAESVAQNGVYMGRDAIRQTHQAAKNNKQKMMVRSTTTTPGRDRKLPQRQQRTPVRVN